VTGRLVPPGDETALAAALIEAVSPQAAAWGARGRERVRRDFDSATEAGRLAALLVHAARGGPRPPRRPDPA
jgi:glycosyltransferase involved in cell wall biosynthesis